MEVIGFAALGEEAMVETLFNGTLTPHTAASPIPYRSLCLSSDLPAVAQ